MAASRVLVMGAAGSVGRLAVNYGLTRGLAVTGFVRTATTPAIPSIRTVVGDALDGGAVDAAVQDSDAVIYALGTRSIGPTTFFSRSTSLLLDAMQRHQVSRLVAITGVGAGDTRGHGGFVYDRIVFPLFTRNIYRDKDRQEALIRDSRLDFTLVRPAPFRDLHRTTPLQVVTEVGNVVLRKISRFEVAQFAVDCVLDQRFNRQSVFIGHH